MTHVDTSPLGAPSIASTAQRRSVADLPIDDAMAVYDRLAGLDRDPDAFGAALAALAAEGYDDVESLWVFCE